MPSAGSIKERCLLVKKDVTGVTPEGWLQVGNARRVGFQRMTDAEAIATANAFTEGGYTATHRGLVETDSEYSVGRLLVRLRDGVNFRICGVVEVGRRNIGTGHRYQKLQLAELPTAVYTA